MANIAEQQALHPFLLSLKKKYFPLQLFMHTMPWDKENFPFAEAMRWNFWTKKEEINNYKEIWDFISDFLIPEEELKENIHLTICARSTKESTQLGCVGLFQSILQLKPQNLFSSKLSSMLVH